MKNKSTKRYEHKVIYNWVEPRTTVLDIGCGDGVLLKMLQERKNCRCRGLDIADTELEYARQSGVAVNHWDLNTMPLLDYGSDTFDNVVICDVLEHILNPLIVLREAVRISRRHIFVSIPNLAEYWNRLDLMMGISPRYYHFDKTIWDSGHIRFLTIKDIKRLAKLEDLNIRNTDYIYFHGIFRSKVKGYYLDSLWDIDGENGHNFISSMYKSLSRIFNCAPNFFASIGIFHFEKLPKVLLKPYLVNNKG